MREQGSETSTASCTCERPIPVERATRKGVAQTECARCERPVPLRLR